MLTTHLRLAAKLSDATAPVCLPGVDREKDILAYPLVLYVNTAYVLCVVYSIAP